MKKRIGAALFWSGAVMSLAVLVNGIVQVVRSSAWWAWMVADVMLFGGIGMLILGASLSGEREPKPRLSWTRRAFRTLGTTIGLIGLVAMLVNGIVNQWTTSRAAITSFTDPVLLSVDGIWLSHGVMFSVMFLAPIAMALGVGVYLLSLRRGE